MQGDTQFWSCADQTFPLYTKLGGVALAVCVSLSSLSKEGISLSATLLIAGLPAHQWLTLSSSFLEVVVDWRAKLWSLLWSRNGELACRNRTKFVFSFFYGVSVKL